MCAKCHNIQNKNANNVRRNGRDEQNKKSFVSFACPHYTRKTLDFQEIYASLRTAPRNRSNFTNI